MCRGRRARILLHLHIQREKIDMVGVLVAETIHPACMCEDAGGRKAWSAVVNDVEFFPSIKCNLVEKLNVGLGQFAGFFFV